MNYIGRANCVHERVSERVDCTSERWDERNGANVMIKKKINERRDTDEYNERADNERGR